MQHERSGFNLNALRHGKLRGKALCRLSVPKNNFPGLADVHRERLRRKLGLAADKNICLAVRIKRMVRVKNEIRVVREPNRRSVFEPAVHRHISRPNALAVFIPSQRSRSAGHREAKHAILVDRKFSEGEEIRVELRRIVQPAGNELFVRFGAEREQFIRFAYNRPLEVNRHRRAERGIEAEHGARGILAQAAQRNRAAVQHKIRERNAARGCSRNFHARIVARERQIRNRAAVDNERAARRKRRAVHVERSRSRFHERDSAQRSRETALRHGNARA